MPDRTSCGARRSVAFLQILDGEQPVFKPEIKISAKIAKGLIKCCSALLTESILLSSYYFVGFDGVRDEQNKTKHET